MTLDPPCVYCGIEAGTTKDHVPPRSLFPKPRPLDLVTVPCCERCRTTQSKDDEYLRTTIALRHDVAATPAGRRVMESVQTALAHPKAQGFATSLLRAVRMVEAHSPAGVYLGPLPTYNVNVERLQRVMCRTLRGLYFHETGNRLPDTHGATTYTVSALATLDDAQQASVMRHGEIALSGTIRTLGDGSVFTYAFQFVSDVPHCSAWAFVLYNCVAFLGTTVRSEDLPPNSRCP